MPIKLLRPKTNTVQNENYRQEGPNLLYGEQMEEEIMNINLEKLVYEVTTQNEKYSEKTRRDPRILESKLYEW